MLPARTTKHSSSPAAIRVPGVYGAYATDGTHVRLLRYGGGTVAVGSRSHTAAKVLGVATGIQGRIWVMWGDDSGGGVAVTRSNKAVTRFERIQHFDPNAAASTGSRATPPRPARSARRRDPERHRTRAARGDLPRTRTAPPLGHGLGGQGVSNKVKKIYKLTATVTDAGDPVAGASVSVKGQKKTTNAKGVVAFTLPSSAAGTATMTVTSPGYNVLTETVHI